MKKEGRKKVRTNELPTEDEAILCPFVEPRKKRIGDLLISVMCVLFITLILVLLLSSL